VPALSNVEIWVLKDGLTPTDVAMVQVAPDAVPSPRVIDTGITAPVAAETMLVSATLTVLVPATPKTDTLAVPGDMAVTANCAVDVEVDAAVAAVGEYPQALAIAPINPSSSNRGNTPLLYRGCPRRCQ
jgi:hypothetical protein